MPEGLAHARRLEFEQRLAQGALAIWIAGLAARRERDRHRRVGQVPVVSDDVEVGQAELVRGEFRQGLDSEAVQPVEHAARLGAEPFGDVEHHALVEGAEQEAVAVALQKFEEAVAEGEVHVRAGAEAVGDEVGEGLVALRQLEIVGGGDIERHQHGLAGAGADRGRPFEGGAAPDRAAGGQAEREGIGHRAGAKDAYEVVVAAALLLTGHDGERRHQVLGDLGHRPDDRLVVGGPVADPARHGADEERIVEEQRHEPDRDSGAVERRQGEADDAALRQDVEIGAYRLRQGGGQALDPAGGAMTIGARRLDPAVAGAVVLILLVHGRGVPQDNAA